MPVVIQEIQINVEVNDTTSPKRAQQPTAVSHNSENERQEIISQCVEEVLRILKEKEER